MSDIKNTQKVHKQKTQVSTSGKASIRIRSKTEYTIEVNDAGETISFDIADVSLPDKLVRMMNKVEALQAELQSRANALDIKDDTKYNEFITNNQLEGARIIAEFFEKAREAADEFLGKGACFKIFGEKNYFTMFEDLTEQLTPHFKKMGITLDQIKRRSSEKYLNAIDGEVGMNG